MHCIKDTHNAIGPNTSDIKKIIVETNSGDYFSYSDEEILAETLKSYFKQFSDDTIISETIHLKNIHVII